VKKREAVERPDLVPLEMSDQMPADRHRHIGHLCERFLHPVFADVTETALPRRHNRIGAMGLRHGDNCHILATSAPRYRELDAPPCLGDPRAQLRKRHSL
jgi:hypothetical protein